MDFVTANKFAEDAEVGEATVESGIPVCSHFFKESLKQLLFFIITGAECEGFPFFGSGYALEK